jgi:hypothetical protein
MKARDHALLKMITLLHFYLFVGVSWNVVHHANAEHTSHGYIKYEHNNDWLLALYNSNLL